MHCRTWKNHQKWLTKWILIYRHTLIGQTRLLKIKIKLMPFSLALWKFLYSYNLVLCNFLDLYNTLKEFNNIVNLINCGKHLTACYCQKKVLNYSVEILKLNVQVLNNIFKIISYLISITVCSLRKKFLPRGLNGRLFLRWKSNFFIYICKSNVKFKGDISKILKFSLH